MYAYADNESLRQNEQEKIKVLTCFKTFIDEISVMNSTSVVGTIDFTDQLSKYNLLMQLVFKNGAKIKITIPKNVN